VKIFKLFLADIALSQKLAEELQYEKDANANEPEPEFLKSFKEQNIWQVCPFLVPSIHPVYFLVLVCVD
jgi:hypothetical protein